MDFRSYQRRISSPRRSRHRYKRLGFSSRRGFLSPLQFLLDQKTEISRRDGFHVVEIQSDIAISCIIVENLEKPRWLYSLLPPRPRFYPRHYRLRLFRANRRMEETIVKICEVQQIGEWRKQFECNQLRAHGILLSNLYIPHNSGSYCSRDVLSDSDNIDNDRYLSRNIISRHRLQFLGVACMMIATKYEEICAPHVEKFCYITDNTYLKDEVLDMETSVLS